MLLEFFSNARLKQLIAIEDNTKNNNNSSYLTVLRTWLSLTCLTVNDMNLYSFRTVSTTNTKHSTTAGDRVRLCVTLNLLLRFKDIQHPPIPPRTTRDPIPNNLNYLNSHINSYTNGIEIPCPMIKDKKVPKACYW